MTMFSPMMKALEKTALTAAILLASLPILAMVTNGLLA
jgi:hypothetical protein